MIDNKINTLKVIIQNSGKCIAKYLSNIFYMSKTKAFDKSVYNALMLDKLRKNINSVYYQELSKIKEFFKYTKDQKQMDDIINLKLKLEQKLELQIKRSFDIRNFESD